MPEGYRVTLHAIGQLPTSVPSLHGYRFTPPQPNHPSNPPPGLIRWHYVQCVIRRFAHTDYRNLQHIVYYELPVRLEGDSDSESNDDGQGEGIDGGHDWPSAALDRGRAVQLEIEELEERKKYIEGWATAS